MSSFQDDFAISLHSWPLKNPDPMSSLPTLIERIDQQLGGFRNITEEGLRLEIAEEEAAAAAGEHDASGDGEKEEEPDRLKVLMEARAEMLHNIHDAHVHAAQALDFVSLLLTKDLPVQASATINPALRDAVPMGSLGMDKLSASRYTDAQRQDNKRVAKAWKAQSLNKSVDSILESATRLEKEIEKETKYWEQILSVSDAGWALCRLPNERHTLGVRFGFSESAPAFKNRSLAALRRNPDGSIYLDQGLASSDPKALRVRIRDSAAGYTGSSTVPLPLLDDGPIESTILQARNTIFDAELWQEINRESRSLASYGVRADDDTITCALTPHKAIVIDLVPLGTSYLSSQVDGKIAEGICLALHLFLSITHRQKYRRRTHPPPPISNQKQATQPYNLLRPLLTRMNHQSALTLIHSLFQPLCNALSSAKVSPLPTYEAISTPLSADMLKGLSPTEIAVISLTDRLESMTTFKVTETTTLTLKSTTAMYPVCTTAHAVSISSDSPLNIICKAPPHANSWNKTEEYLLYATSCALASSFASPSNESPEMEAWEPTIAGDILCKQSADGLGGLGKQLIFKVECQNGTAKLRVKWENMNVTPRYDTPSSGKNSKRGNGVYEWRSSGTSSKSSNWDDGEGEVAPSLQDAVEEAGRR